MSRPRTLLLALAALTAGPAWGQFQLYLVNGSLQQAVPRLYDFGAIQPGASTAVPFRIQNISTAPAALNFVTVSGSGFTLSNLSQSLPATLAAQQFVDFTVVFQSSGTGIYSAALDSVAISVTFTATVPVALTCQLTTPTGVAPLAAPVDFGAVARGASSTLHVTMWNQTNVTLAAPVPVVTGAGFALGGASPGGAEVEPTGSVGFDMLFSPTADGVQTGLLTLGSVTYPLTGTGVEPPLPSPQLTVSLPQPGSAQQGSVAVSLSAASQSSGAGTVTLTFQPSVAQSAAVSDPGIAFAAGGQSATFTVSPGDTQGHFGSALTAPFQTGTTAGTLTIAAQLGGNTSRQTVAILPAVVGLTAAQGLRLTGSIEVDLTGFDNTRTAGRLAFTFYDPAGDVIGSGPIAADGTANFASYFQTAAGGTFLLKAVFPLAGDSSQVTTFQAAVTNSAGTATTVRTGF
jgi:hypothetical protein